MKPFDKEAAMQGAAVCSTKGQPARVIAFDLKNTEYPLCALITETDGHERCIQTDEKGEFPHSRICLHMRDDDYLDRLARGQYSPISAKPIAIPIEAGQIEFSGPLTRREEFAKAAMQGIMAANEAGIGHVTATVAQWAVAVADALCAELDKTEQLNTK